ncbi:MAG: hypothetical protein RLZZ312_1072 [Bacteroidota bacterium]|jgi:tRNA(fMet)-specific endonuclease VapC
MIGNHIIDSNVIIDFFRNKENKLIDLMNKEQVSVSVIVVGELIYGAENSPQIKKHVNQVESLLANMIVIDIDLDTAKIYAKIRSELKKSGKPIPENDIWIAATAIKNNLTLITNDRHFDFIKVLKCKEF